METILLVLGAFVVSVVLYLLFAYYDTKARRRKQIRQLLEGLKLRERR